MKPKPNVLESEPNVFDHRDNKRSKSTIEEKIRSKYFLLIVKFLFRISKGGS